MTSRCVHLHKHMHARTCIRVNAHSHTSLRPHTVWSWLGVHNVQPLSCIPFRTSTLSIVIRLVFIVFTNMYHFVNKTFFIRATSLQMAHHKTSYTCAIPVTFLTFLPDLTEPRCFDETTTEPVDIPNLFAMKFPVTVLCGFQ